MALRHAQWMEWTLPGQSNSSMWQSLSIMHIVVVFWQIPFLYGTMGRVYAGYRGRCPLHFQWFTHFPTISQYNNFSFQFFHLLKNVGKKRRKWKIKLRLCSISRTDFFLKWHLKEKNPHNGKLAEREREFVSICARPSWSRSLCQKRKPS